MGAFRAFVFDMLDVALGRFMGPVGCMTSFVEGGLRRLMPAGSYKKACGRLLVSVSAMHGVHPTVSIAQCANCSKLRQGNEAGVVLFGLPSCVREESRHGSHSLHACVPIYSSSAALFSESSSEGRSYAHVSPTDK